MNRLIKAIATPLDVCTNGLRDGGPLPSWSSGPPDQEVTITMHLDAYTYERFMRDMEAYFLGLRHQAEEHGRAVPALPTARR